MQTALSSEAPRRLRRFFLVGVLFEVVLLALGFLLPESWLQVEIRNLLVITHFPLMLLMFVLQSLAWALHLGDSIAVGILFSLVGLVLMGVIWGFLIYLITCLAKAVTVRLSQRQRSLVRYSLGFFCVVIFLWAVVSGRPATSIPFRASPQVESAVNDNTAFALDLYQKLKDEPGNLFFSPYSISISLAMTYAGARGQTESEMAQALHFRLNQTDLPAAFSKLTDRMNRIQRWNRITLKTANALWCQKGYRFTDAFINLVHKYYRAEARQVDFNRSPRAAADEINSWVEHRTDGKIKAAISPTRLMDGTRLVLCNAIYFKGKWQRQFKTSDTKPALFHVTTNETVTVPMMRQKDRFKTAFSEDDSVELLELPYSGTDLSMVVLLPEIEYSLPNDQNPGLPSLEQKLTADHLQKWLVALDDAVPHETLVMLPRFVVTQSFDLVKPLKSLGMVSAFDNAANFSGMDETTNLYISDVIHTAFVEVNESGTEAGAVTFSLALAKSQSGQFIVDHPFIFLIRDNGSGTILFIGRIVDPTMRFLGHDVFRNL